MREWQLPDLRICLCGTIADVYLIDIPTTEAWLFNGRFVGTGIVRPPHLEVDTLRWYDTPDGPQQDTVEWPLPADWKARLHLYEEYSG